MPALITNKKPEKLASPHEVKVFFDENASSSSTPSVLLTSDLRERYFDDKLTYNHISVKLLGCKRYTRFLIYNVEDVPLEGSNTILISDYAKFNNVDTTIDSALITNIKPIEIKKVVMMFNSQFYDILKKMKGQDLFKMFQKLGINVIHEGDELFSRSGKVMLCDPVDQGILTKETTITIVKDTNHVLSLETEIDAVDSLDVSSYLSLTKKTELHDFAVSQIDDFTLRSINPNDTFDNEYIAYATTSDLSKIGVLNGNFAELIIDETNKKLVQLVAFTEPNNYKSGKIYLSPIFIINNGSPKQVKIKPTKEKLSSIPIADSITIKKITSLEALTGYYQQPSLTGLKTYFESKQRMISLGDLIPIAFDSVLAKSLLQQSSPEISYPVGDPDSVIWFKVTEVKIGELEETSKKQYLFDTNHTALKTSGELKSKLPDLKYDWYSYLKLGNNFDYLSGDEKVFSYAKKLAKLFKSTLSNKNLRTTVLLESLNRNVGKSFIIENVSRSLGLHIAIIDGYEVLNPSSNEKTIGFIRGKLDRAAEETESLVVFIKHIEALAFKQDEQSGAKPSILSSKLVELMEEYTQNNVIFVATTNDSDKIPEEVRSKFRFEIEIPVPSEEERKRIFKYLIEQDNGFALRNDIDFNSLALQSAGLTPRDLKSIVENAKALSLERLEDLSETLNVDISVIINNNPIKLIPEDFEKSINDARNKFSDSIGAPRIPNVTWDDIGGLDLVKDEILDTIDMPLKHPELFANGVKKRSGILFYGPPGTGKTLLAKAIATNFSLNFFSVKGPELLNMYIGESEANVRKVFQKARDAKPCVVFFDELDSVAPKRGNQGDSGGVMDRIVSQLLAELDGMSGGDSGDGVFVVGATNRPDLLDEALLRPGRFDKMLYLGISDTHDKQQNILTALTRKFQLDPNVDLKKVAESCSFNFTGADFYALCSDSMLNAMTRVANEVDKKIEKYNSERKYEPVSTRWWFDNVATKEDITVLVQGQDFEKARRELSPSVSTEELEHYLRVRANFEGGKTKSQ